MATVLEEYSNLESWESLLACGFQALVSLKPWGSLIVYLTFFFPKSSSETKAKFKGTLE